MRDLAHAHRWRIESPNGSKLLAGACDCGATRMYHVTDHEMSKKWRHGSPDGNLTGMGELVDQRGARERARTPRRKR